MSEFTDLRLGKLPPRRDPRTFKLSRYLLGPIAGREASAPKIDWRMFCNDRVGCCTRAAQGHLMQIWGERVPTDTEILEAYAAISDYPKHDRGANMLDALKHWRKIGLGSHRIRAYAKINASDRREIEASIDLLGGVYVGCQLPLTSKTRDLWVASPRTRLSNDWLPGSWGGHTMTAIAYSGASLTIVSWGRTFQVSRQWWNDYVDEAYVIFNKDASNDVIDVDLLAQDLRSL